MNFAQPQFLYLLLALPALAGLRLWADWRARSRVAGMTAPRLRARLVVGVSSARVRLIFLLQLLALGCFILALAGPRWGEERSTQLESGRNILIAIDTSRSMLANDIAPDRLTRARLAAQDLLSMLKSDRVGLIAFAGSAYLQAPLTTDHEAVIESIQSLDFTSVPRGGSEIGRALKLAMETCEKSPARNHGLILFSDGGEPDVQVREFAEQAAKKNILVLTVGVGTDSGSLIPDPDPERAGDYVRDGEGNVVKTRLEGAVLQQVAAATGGRYLKLGTQPLAVGVVRDLFAALQAQSNAAKQRVTLIERFYWPLSIGVVLLMCAWFIRPSPARRAALPALALLLAGLVPQAAPAADSPPFWAAWLRRDSVPDRSALEAQVQGLASHEAKDYDRAIASFSQALTSDETGTQRRAHQGLAHSLYDQGDRTLAKQPKFTLKAWRDALKHFDAALKTDPGNRAMQENREFVQKRLDQLQQQLDAQEQKGKQGKKGEKGQKGQKGEKGEEGEGEGDPEEQGEGENGEDRSRKESLGKGEGEPKEQPLPEGQLQAGKEGEANESKGEPKEQAQSADDAQQDATGFSRNEARAFLRTYADDQKKAQLVRPRDPAVKGKDW